MLSKAQGLLYFRLWGQVRKVQPGADRKAMHAEPSEGWPKGLPESHTAWNNEHLDEWIARCKAVTQPGNYRAQRRQAEMASTRERVYIGHLLAALGRPEEYAQAIVTRMHRGERAEYSGAGSGVSLETLEPEAARKIMIALKKECRRVWSTKAELLRAIHTFATAYDLDQAEAYQAICAALNAQDLGPKGLDGLVYEALLVALSALRRLAHAEPAPGEDLGEIECPF